MVVQSGDLELGQDQYVKWKLCHHPCHHHRLGQKTNSHNRRLSTIILCLAFILLILCAALTQQTRHECHTLVDTRYELDRFSSIFQELLGYLSIGTSRNKQEHQQHNQEQNLVGVIGGIGPIADARLSQLILELDIERCANRTVLLSDHDDTGFYADSCHTRYLLYSNPKIPNNNLANLGTGPLSVDALVDSAKVLQKAGATTIAFGCTAAYTWMNEVTNRTGIPIIDLLNATAAAVAKEGHTNIGLLEVDGTIRAGRFARAFNRYGIDASLPNDNDQAVVMRSVSAIKSGQNVERAIAELSEVMRSIVDDHNVTAIVLGCTDIAAALGTQRHYGVPIFDTLRVLAKEIIRMSDE